MPTAHACRAALLLVVLGLLSCGQATGQNPASLWVSYSSREVDLVLVDYEPPPF